MHTTIISPPFVHIKLQLFLPLHHKACSLLLNGGRSGLLPVEAPVAFAEKRNLCFLSQVHGVEPLASPDDCLLAEQIAKGDPKVREQLKLRGVTDMDLVACDPWSGVQSITAT